jgi:hypothetical protein
MQQSPIPIQVQYAINYAGIFVIIICGIAFLHGKNWARLLYIIWTASSLIIGFATSPMKAALIPGSLVFLIIVLILYRPSANAFFAPPRDLEFDDA